MTRLSRPDCRLRASWEEAVAEFEPGAMHGSGLWEYDEVPTGEEGCRTVVAHLVAQADPATPMPGDRVRCSYFWITDGEPESFVGYLALRHSLNDFLLEQGGHIGYAVRPSRRREGHATRALRLAVGEAAALGLDRVLVTCDEDNLASRRTIEGAGGVLEDVRGIKRRYWIAT
jgi:predicted acetyltransferase